MTTQDSLMRFCPATGDPEPYPSRAQQYRRYFGSVAWLYNSWTGHKRDARDIGSDPTGQLIVTDNVMYGAHASTNTLLTKIKIFHTVALDRNTCWECPDCGYDPGNSSLPHSSCLNCGKVLERTEVSDGVTTVFARPTFKGSAALERYYP